MTDKRKDEGGQAGQQCQQNVAGSEICTVQGPQLPNRTLWQP